MIKDLSIDHSGACGKYNGPNDFIVALNSAVRYSNSGSIDRRLILFLSAMDSNLVEDIRALTVSKPLP
ncbi:hypothetical protein C0992_006453 [Termitomyces sp. T32_za158]|nr:hypothetical protein C0992_006453 [Termitomyces sp. T32_za158]